jgi:hypothetical protein
MEPKWKEDGLMHAFGLCWKAEGLIFSVYWHTGDIHATLKVRKIEASSFQNCEKRVKEVAEIVR